MARKSQQQLRIERLLRKQSGAIEKAILEAIAKAKPNVDRAALIRFLEQGDIERAVQLFRIERGVLFPLENAIRDALIGGGLAAIDDLPKGLAGRFGFDGNHSRAVALAQQQAASLVTYVSDDAIASARKIIVEGLETNRSIKATARDLAGRRVGRRRVGGIIGLTEQQTDRMINLRSMLSDPDRVKEYFKGSKPRYKESNRRLDGLVRKALKEGRALRPAEIERITEAYKVKATGARAKRVAENEAFTAQASGRNEAYQQLVDNGRVESATCRWQHNLSVNPREDHVGMDGAIKPVGEDFVFPDGTRMSHPHDPRGGAEHSNGCRCIGIYRIKLPRG